MAENQLTANDIISVIRENMSTLDDQSKTAILVAVLGQCATHKQVQSKGKGINLYTKIGDRIHVRGNMGVYVSGAKAEDSVLAILDAPSLKGVPLKEQSTASRDESISAEGVGSILEECGL
tara:strand:+ start:152 stop:514 length:363 start_codon:yes stop_codon:yes gene_type:complete